MGDKILGKNLKDARWKLGLTQKEVAEKAGISTNWYARLERGEENVALDTWKTIFKILKLKIPYPFS